MKGCRTCYFATSVGHLDNLVAIYDTHYMLMSINLHWSINTMIRRFLHMMIANGDTLRYTWHPIYPAMIHLPFPPPKNFVRSTHPLPHTSSKPCSSLSIDVCPSSWAKAQKSQPILPLEKGVRACGGRRWHGVRWMGARDDGGPPGGPPQRELVSSGPAWSSPTLWTSVQQIRV